MSDNVSMERESPKSNKDNEGGQERNKFWAYHKHSQLEQAGYQDSFSKVAQKFPTSTKMIMNGFQPNVGETCSVQSSYSDSVKQGSPCSNDSRSPPPYPVSFDGPFNNHHGMNEVFGNYSDNDQQFCSQQVSDIFFFAQSTPPSFCFNT